MLMFPFIVFVSIPFPNCHTHVHNIQSNQYGTHTIHNSTFIRPHTTVLIVPPYATHAHS